jgi:glucose-6-phosphate 1-dehydrogenase
VEEYEKEHSDHQARQSTLFYFAIPPTSLKTAVAISKTTMQDEARGWSRLIIKPFGRDLKSFEVLDKALSKHFTEGNCLG